MRNMPAGPRWIVAAALAAALVSGCAGQPAAAADPLPPAGIPPGLLLPGEGERSTSPDFTDWTTDNALGQAWLLDPCRPTAYPTDGARTAFRTVSRTGPEAADARQLAVYPTPQTAADTVAGFRRALAACATGGNAAEGARWQWVTAEVPGLGDEGLVAASTVGGPGFSPSGARIAVTRSGSTVFLAYLGGESSTAELDGGTELAQQVARTYLDSLPG
jgi:hypothetical protein